MALHILKKRIRATGSDANGLFIAMASDERLREWDQNQTGSPEFQRMVKEAIEARAKQKGEA